MDFHFPNKLLHIWLIFATPDNTGPGRHCRRREHGQVCGHQARAGQHRDVHTLRPAQLLRIICSSCPFKMSKQDEVPDGAKNCG